MDLKINIFNIIILMGIIQGMFFSGIVLFSKRYSSQKSSYLVYTVLSLSLSNLQYWFTDSKLDDYYPFLTKIRIPCELLILPMFYFFVSYYLELEVSKKIKFLFFTPFIISFLFEILITLNTHSQQKFVDDDYYYIEEFISFAFTILIIVSTFQIILKYEKDNSTFDFKKVKAQTSWIKQLLIVGFITCLFWVIILFLMRAYHNVALYYGLWISISLIVYWISYVGLHHLSIFKEREKIRKSLNAEIPKVTVDTASKSTEKLIENFEEIAGRLFSNPNLRLENIALEMNITSNYLSNILSSKDISFPNYINTIRVENVKRMLKSDEFSQYTITAIGLEAGFNSNASFYRAFKKTTGITPIAYRNAQ